MDEKNFLNKYSGLIGQPVNDSFFNTDRLTKTALLNKLVELFYMDKITECYQTNNLNDLLSLLEKIISISLKLGFKIKKDWLSFDLLPHSIGNNKIGSDTLCISVNSGLLCYMGLTDNCSNCHICYAKNSNKMYTAEFLKNTISQIVILKIMLGKISVHTVLRNTIYSINCIYSGPQINRLKFLRLNVNGDILSNDMLVVINNVSKVLVSVFNLYGAYSYTHNTELDFALCPDIVFGISI